MALLLWGVHMVQSGVQRAYGPELRRSLGLALGGRFRAFAAGLGVTAALQSSTATGIMTASFAASGVVGLVPALAVMLGANVGTTLIVQVLSFDVSRAAPILVLAGVVLFRRGRSARPRDVGRVLIGFGLMLMALRHMLDLLTPYEDSPSLRTMLGLLATDPYVAAVAAALVTWLAHSSVAVVLLVMSLAEKGVLPFEAALAFVVGANLGSALNPLFEGGAPSDVDGRRVAVGNVLNRLVGCALALPCLWLIGPATLRLEPDLSRAVADFHTAFNLVLAALFLPLLGLVGQVLRRALPEKVDAADPGRPVHLDPAAIGTPPIALGLAARETLRMADALAVMLGRAADALDRGDRARIAETRRQDDTLDKLHAAIRDYVLTIDADDMTAADEHRSFAILAFATHLEQAGDILDRDIMALVSRRLKRGLSLAREDLAGIRGLIARLEANSRTAASIFLTEDVRAARLLADEKSEFRDIEARALEDHFAALRTVRGPGAEARTLHVDLLRDLKRINDHLVQGAAYPVLQHGGELLSSRLKAVPAKIVDRPETNARRSGGGVAGSR